MVTVQWLNPPPIPRYILNYLARREAMENASAICESCAGDGCVIDEEGNDMTCPDCDGTGVAVDESESENIGTGGANGTDSDSDQAAVPQ